MPGVHCPVSGAAALDARRDRDRPPEPRSGGHVSSPDQERRIFRDLIRALSGDGDVDVLMSTHDVAGLAEESDHVTVLTAGAVRFTGTTAD
ncbi:hypothetical protein GCM10010387_07180 [Streptomyces inusitatus]|uniref:Uncharacterized protein n=1 Tax=Streptomyces inusitatus TaxID=68221 RepID=A0A918PPE8_9ACTN|nr:hypothetical protein GCM10010387_07180 [Streptomyces inusitatus]